MILGLSSHIKITLEVHQFLNVHKQLLLINNTNKNTKSHMTILITMKVQNCRKCDEHILE